MNDNAKKQVPLRLSPKLYAAIAAWQRTISAPSTAKSSIF